MTYVPACFLIIFFLICRSTRDLKNIEPAKQMVVATKDPFQRLLKTKIVVDKVSSDPLLGSVKDWIKAVLSLR